MKARGHRGSVGLVVLLAVSLAACDAVGPTPTPSGIDGSPPSSSGPQASESFGPQPSPSPTAVALPLPADYRPEGPWLVEFTAPGRDTVREVYIMKPTCEAGPCDVDVAIQDFFGDAIGSGVFRYIDGSYRFDGTNLVGLVCGLSAELVPPAAEETSTTALVIAGYRPEGTAVISPALRGDRSVETRPVGIGCEAGTVAFAAKGEPTRFTTGHTPRPKPPAVVSFAASYFGRRTTVKTYDVTGATAFEVALSIAADGPQRAWLGGSAAGMTTVTPENRWRLATKASGACRIAVKGKKAVKATYTVTLPRWKPPKNTPASTIAWWNDQLSAIAAHEKAHVDIYRAATKAALDAVGASTCDDVRANVDAAWSAARSAGCDLDMREYGEAAGLTLEACLAE